MIIIKRELQNNLTSAVWCGCHPITKRNRELTCPPGGAVRPCSVCLYLACWLHYHLLGGVWRYTAIHLFTPEDPLIALCHICDDIWRSTSKCVKTKSKNVFFKLVFSHQDIFVSLVISNPSWYQVLGVEFVWVFCPL